MAAYLRWEGGEWGDAQRQMMRAEVVSRDGDDEQRALAMGEAARCLALLERDLSQAEALLLEARAMAQRSGVESPGMLHAAAMLRLHEGREEEASKLFERAQSLARSRGDRQSEFQILEHRLLLALDRDEVDGARGLVDQLMDIGVKLRGGSEAPAAAVMQAVVKQAGGEDALEQFERDAEALRNVDAKQHLLNALLRMGEIELKAGEHDRAARRAEEALKLGEILQRPSDIAQARLLMLRTHEVDGDTRGAKKLLAQLKKTDLSRLSARVRKQVATDRGHPARK
jgi:tetratricopeptide (TPR) repeat protein